MAHPVCYIPIAMVLQYGCLLQKHKFQTVSTTKNVLFTVAAKPIDIWNSFQLDVLKVMDATDYNGLERGPVLKKLLTQLH